MNLFGPLVQVKRLLLSKHRKCMPLSENWLLKDILVMCLKKFLFFMEAV